MKLRVPLPVQQLLFAITGGLFLAAFAHGQDTIITTDNQQQVVKVIGVSTSGQTLDFLVSGGHGQLGLPLNRVKEVRMAPPAEFTQALAAYQAKDFPKALKLIVAVVAKFRGMPSPWAQQAAAMLGELYITTGDLDKAQTAYEDFKRFYPAGGSIQSEIGLARLALAKKDYATAKQKLEPITAAALNEKALYSANGAAYSQAFLVSGQVKDATGDFSGALQDYLRTVTVFYQDRVAAASAQERADALRNTHPDATVP